MKCVHSVSFSVLVNGQPSSSFHLSWGFCQEDPLSPYLFMFCAKALSSLIRRNVERGALHGLRICRRAPIVSRLFFANDTIIIGRASKSELGHVREILECYEAASGQAINLNKSEIMFSGGVSLERCDILANLIGVRRVDQYATYLGIPMLANLVRLFSGRW